MILIHSGIQICVFFRVAFSFDYHRPWQDHGALEKVNVVSVNTIHITAVQLKRRGHKTGRVICRSGSNSFSFKFTTRPYSSYSLENCTRTSVTWSDVV